MSIKRLRNQLDKAEREIRQWYSTSFEPQDPNDALCHAIETRSVEQHHLDTFWERYGQGWTDTMIRHARERRVTRLAGNWEAGHTAWSYRRNATTSAIELLSRHPHDAPEADGCNPIPALWNYIEAELPFSIDDLYHLDLWGERSRVGYDLDREHLARIMQPPDALELRKRIWEPHSLIAPPLQRL
jgi:hypothetical protein